MSKYKRLTTNNLEECDPEYDFCIGCKYFGEIQNRIANVSNIPHKTIVKYKRKYLI